MNASCRKSLSFIVMLLSVTLITGCGMGSQTPDLSPVKGVVTVEGQPVPEGQVTFVPDSTQGTRGPSFVGELQKNGTFSVRGPNGVEGAIPGTYHVVINRPAVSSADLMKAAQERKVNRSEFKKSSLIPLVYETPNSTPLKVIVEPEKPNEYAFDLGQNQYSRMGRSMR
ncbi:MAG: hypothetical protein HUJ26_18100 [Planctomycetaceae bacterium]|nr:hypothetical protein [Planctomycetaceae bacterium]